MIGVMAKMQGRQAQLTTALLTGKMPPQQPPQGQQPQAQLQAQVQTFLGTTPTVMWAGTMMCATPQSPVWRLEFSAPLVFPLRQCIGDFAPPPRWRSWRSSAARGWRSFLG